jgi:hypothetical protein
MSEFLRRYLLAAIRLHSRANPAGWSDIEILDTAALLPFEVDFDEWRKRLGIPDEKEAKENAQQQAAIMNFPGYSVSPAAKD